MQQIPDLLDEARWELEWILTMQGAESGGFYPRIQGDAGERKIMDLNGCTTDDTADRLWAAGVLWRVTSNTSARTTFWTGLIWR